MARTQVAGGFPVSAGHLAPHSAAGLPGPDEDLDPTVIEDTVRIEPIVPPQAPALPAPPAPEPEPEAAPVFVDASGRRQRRVRRLGRLAAIPAAGYLALLVSSLLGGPTLGAPFLPQPAAPPVARPASTPTADVSADPSADSSGAASAHAATPHPSGTAHRATGGPQPTPGSAPGQPSVPTPGTTPSAPVSTAPTHGRPSTAPDHKHSKSP